MLTEEQINKRGIVVTGVVKKEWAPVREKKKKATSIVVLLADPTKPDPLNPLCIFDDDDLYTVDQLKDSLQDLSGYSFNYINNHDTLHSELANLKSKTDFVFNLCDEGFSNDDHKELHVLSMLEMLDIKYIGSGPQCLAYCCDKSLVRGIAKEMEIPVPEGFFIKPEDSIYELPVGFPVIAKPNFSDSGFCISRHSVANTIDELMNSISDIREKSGYEKPILVEEFLTGCDLSVGIIGNLPDAYQVLPIIEKDYSDLPPELPRICGYEARWDPESPYWDITSKPASLDAHVEKMLLECSIKLFERLECRDYCRMNWRIDASGTPKLLEVNPNPGWCWDGHLALMARLEGLSYTDMLEAIIEAAGQRIGNNK